MHDYQLTHASFVFILDEIFTPLSPIKPCILLAKYWIINVNIVRIGIFSCLKIRFGPSTRFLLKGLLVRPTRKEGKKLPNTIFYYWLYLPKVFSQTFSPKNVSTCFFILNQTPPPHLLLLILYNDSYITKICWLYSRLPGVDVFCRRKIIP